VRARMSEARRKALADPAVRARMSEASRKAWADPAVRARMSEAIRRSRDAGNICSPCLHRNCLLCDGDGCRCVCSLEMDVRRPRRIVSPDARQEAHGSA
jgi:hypothetical protein